METNGLKESVPVEQVGAANAEDTLNPTPEAADTTVTAAEPQAQTEALHVTAPVEEPSSMEETSSVEPVIEIDSENQEATEKDEPQTETEPPIEPVTAMENSATATEETPGEAETPDFSEEEAELKADAPEFDLGEENEEDREHKEHSPNEIDFNGKTKSEVISLFGQALQTLPVQTLRPVAEAAKIAFYKAWRQEVDRLKKEFTAAGHPEVEFVVPVDSDEEKLKATFAEYRRKRDEYIANSEKQKEENYKIKLRIIEELKELVNSNETMNATFNTFRELQNRWKETGAVPQGYVKDLWETYHLHIENFYGFIKINKELRDLDLKKNSEAKLRLCEEAEALILDPSPVSSFHKLQKLHEQWRETGPVSIELKEVLWERFREASARINKRHQEHFEEIKDEQRRNLELKTELCIKAEELLAGPYATRKEWDEASDKLIEIQKVWKTIGFAPKKENTRIYERFRAACDSFFETKRHFFLGIREQFESNLREKLALCEAAEALQDSTEWKKTTDRLIELQKQWKIIGPVSRKHSDVVWKRFRKACDTFFESKSKHFAGVDAQYAENLARKQALLEEIKAFEITERESSFEALKEFQRRWSQLGFVPIKQKDKLQAEYRAVIDALFGQLRGNERDRKIERFKDRITTLKDSKNTRSIRYERERLYNKVKQLESDIALLENNIGFFAKSKNAEAMIRYVNDKIEKTRAEMKKLK